MSLCCIKFVMLTNNKNIKTKRKADEKINLYSRCIDCGFKNLQILMRKD